MFNITKNEKQKEKHAANQFFRSLLGHCALSLNRRSAARKDAARMPTLLDIHELRFEALTGRRRMASSKCL
ncbi:MAG TPA: hypothetical protein VFE61_23000, partial [Candidatus Sulfotelmatobacter sp.]|nr:hypothetical protein [Candidatus Sulfotelmatobacter sp.]